MVEIIVVISIMALLSAIALPVFSKWSSSIRYREAALGIASELKLGRDTAVTANTETRVEFDLDGRRYRLTQGNLQTGSTSWSVIKTWEELYAELDWATGSGCGGAADMNIVFRPNGSSGGGEVCIKDGSGADRFKVVVSSISGRVRVE
jgi:Tfp pilus assembly protein FimT